MRYLLAEALLRLVKPGAGLLIGTILYLLATGPLGEPGSVVLALACWTAAAALILLLETGII